MAKYVVTLTYTLAASVEIEAGSLEEAERKWEERESDEDIEPDEEFIGGVPWTVYSIEPKQGE